jgi:hypothetical protein
MVRLLIVVSIAFSVGCAAHHVRKEGNEGIVAVPDDSNVWPTYNHDRAIKLIQEHVGPDYEIIKQEMVVSGQYTTNNQQVTQVPVAIDPDLPFLTRNQQVVTNNQVVQDKHEWYIYYRKRGPSSTGIAAAPTAAPANPISPVGGIVQPPASAVVK